MSMPPLRLFVLAASLAAALAGCALKAPPTADE
jgi:predicted small lipoprotein YifL